MEEQQPIAAGPAVTNSPHSIPQPAGEEPMWEQSGLSGETIGLLIDLFHHTDKDRWYYCCCLLLTAAACCSLLLLLLLSCCSHLFKRY